MLHNFACVVAIVTWTWRWEDGGIRPAPERQRQADPPSCMSDIAWWTTAKHRIMILEHDKNYSYLGFESMFKSSKAKICYLSYYSCGIKCDVPWPHCWREVWEENELRWPSVWCSPPRWPPERDYARTAAKQHLNMTHNSFFSYAPINTTCKHTYPLAVETLKENDAHRPHVDLRWDFRWIFTDDETLRRQIPANCEHPLAHTSSPSPPLLALAGKLSSLAVNK